MGNTEKVQFMLKLLFILQTGVQGVSITGEVTQSSLVSVLRGQSVTINCTFIYNGASDHWIHAVWHRISLRESNYSYGNYKPTCIPDVILSHLNHCVSSLKLENVSSDQSDYNYVCVVKIPSVNPPIERSGPGTRIQSYEPSEIFTGHGALVVGHKSNLTCSAKGLYFENISFIWACHGANIIKNFTTQMSRTITNGTPVASSQFEITPKMTDHGTVCRCQINHATFSQPVINEIKLHIMYGPQDPTIMYRLASSDNYRHQIKSSISVPMDSFLELKCCVDSNPISTVIWMKDNENYTEILQLESGLNNSNVKIRNFQPIGGGVYWCVANNSYGWRKASVRISVKGDQLLYILVSVSAVIGFIAVVTIYLYLICKRQLKDPVNVSVEVSQEIMDRNITCNSNSDTIYAFVRRDNLQQNPIHETADYVNEEKDEEVSYADIVIHNPKQQCHNQWPKHTSDIKEKSTGKDSKYVHGSSPHKHIDDTSEYSTIQISYQDLRPA